jgi:hypothetical protein
MRFKVTYATGLIEEVEQSDCDNVEMFCNTHFGSTWEMAHENGAEVEMILPLTEPANPEPEPTPAPTPEPTPESTPAPTPEPV